MSTQLPGAAFFDVDETLISVKSMFSFLKYYLAERGFDSREYTLRRAHLQKMSSDGAPRQNVNRSFYTNFVGERLDEILQIGVNWFEHESAKPGFYNPAPVADLVRLRAAGTHIVLVSGSFQACLAPIAKALEAHEWFGTDLHIVGGRITGATGVPMIGVQKAVALREVAQRRGISLADCVAYGDHASDIPMLQTAGCAVAVGDDPALRKEADNLGWRLLPLC